MRRRHLPRLHEGVRGIADQFDRRAGILKVVRGAGAVICTRRLRQLVVRIAGVGEGSAVGGKYRSHGPVLPVSMLQRGY